MTASRRSGRRSVPSETGSCCPPATMRQGSLHQTYWFRLRRLRIAPTNQGRTAMDGTIVQPGRDTPRHAWPPGLTRVPFWVYQGADVARAEQARIFQGPVWNFLCLEVDIPNQGDFRTTF